MSLFYKNSHAKDLLQTYCRACHLALVKARQATPEGRAYTRQYVATHQATMRAARTRWREANREHIATKARTRYRHNMLTNPAYVARKRLQSKRYKLAHPEANRAHVRKHYWKDVERSRRRNRERYQQNLELRRQQDRVRYQHQKGKK